MVQVSLLSSPISCFIDPFGRVFDPQPWDKATAIKMDIPAKTDLTFFVEHGELIFEFAVLATICLVIWNLFFLIKSKIRRG
jgi:apolipoprotein N-acyltransferase